jgi:hypothetical protein
MNRKQRTKNRDTARQLAKDIAPPCPECGDKGPHWVGFPQTLEDVLIGTEQVGFWTCNKFYGPDGKRLPSNDKAQGGAACGASPGAKGSAAHARKDDLGEKHG